MNPPEGTERRDDEAAGEHPVDPRWAAQEAAVAYWRDVARDRRREAARVQRRPLVRAAIALDRRTATAQAALGERGRRVGEAAERARVRLAALAHRNPTSGARPPEGDGAAPPAPGVAARTLLLHLGPTPAVPVGAAVELRALDPSDPGWLAAADEAVASADAEVVVLLGPRTTPVAPDWAAVLAAVVLEGRTVAAAPLVLHPTRGWRAATPDDGRVRSLGLDVVVDTDGTPVPRARGAGTVADPGAPGDEVASATGAAVAVRRDAWLAAGGLTGSAAQATSAHPAVVDLCRRLRLDGGAIRTVPAAVVEDATPVDRRAELRSPVDVDDPGWRRVVEAGGPALLRSPSRGEDPAPPSVVITTAVPSAKIAPRSGDWLYAGLFAEALRRAGHAVRVQTADRADDLAGRVGDVHLVLRGLEPVRRTSGQAHVLWVISHPEALDVAECDAADLVLVASPRFADHLRTLTRTPVEVLLQATEPRRFRPGTVDPAHHHAVTVVANARGVHRAAVADAVAAGLGPAVYGGGWDAILDPASIVSPYAPAELLPTVYRSADLVLNDHWDTMRHWGFVSNRIFDVLACGTTVVSDALPELAELFGDGVPTWTDAADLRAVVDELRADPARTAARTAAARDLVLGAHTFDHRAAQLAETLRRRGLAR